MDCIGFKFIATQQEFFQINSASLYTCLQFCSTLSMARAKDDAKSVVDVTDAATCTTTNNVEIHAIVCTTNNVEIHAIVDASKCVVDTSSATRTTMMGLFNTIIFNFDNTIDSQKCKYVYYYTQICQIKSTQVLLQSTRTY